MKNKISFLAIALLTPLCAYYQVGALTSNLQGAFHVDGKKDNLNTGVLSSIQQANDIIVTANGNMGIGILLFTLIINNLEGCNICVISVFFE